MTRVSGNENKDNTFTWRPGDVILDLYEVRPVVEGLADAAEEKSCHQGGFGQVYKVYHRGWNLELAMKAPLPGVFENEAQVEDFTRECETWIDLGLHPHVVTCYYVRNLSGQPLVFAEYLSGGSLKDWISSGLLYEGGHEKALIRILDIAIQTARGLRYAHERGLVHQDVKPANIMLTPEGQAKISDFGTARARAKAAAGKATVNPGTILVSRGGMTPAYCSPEQSLGEKLNRRTDIWSWGLTVLEMFTGEVTWVSGVAAAQALEGYLRHGGETEEIPPMPHDLKLLLERCFQSEEQRPQNFGQVAAELKQIYHACCGSEYLRAEPKAAEDYASSLNNRALSMHDLGRKTEAEKLWRDALKHDPAHLSATYNLGLIEWRSGRVTDVALINKIKGLFQSQSDARALYLLAMVHAERFDYRSAVKCLKEILNKDTVDYEALKLLEKLKPIETKGAQCTKTFVGHTSSVDSVCLSTDNRYALSGSADATIKLWDVESGECLRTYEGHKEGVTSVCLSADGRYAISGSYDGLVKLWDLESGECLHTFVGHSNSVNSVSLSVDNRYAFSGSSDMYLKLWDLESGKCLRTYEDEELFFVAVGSVSLSSDNRRALTAGSEDSRLILWDLKSGECLRTFEGHDGGVNSVCLSFDNRYALSGSWDKTLKLWEVESGGCLRTFEGHRGKVNSVHLSYDDRYALSGSDDKTVRMWEMESGKCMRTFEGHTNEVSSVYLGADGRFALSGNWDDTLKLWYVPLTDMGNKRFYAQLEASPPVRSEDVLSAEKVFNDHLIAVENALKSSDYKQAFLMLKRVRTMPGRMYDRRFLDLWSKLYTRYNQSAIIHSWHLRTFKGHTDRVWSVILSKDGRFALSGGDDKTLKLWDVETGECLRIFEGHAHRVNSVSCSVDGLYALSGSTDDTLKLWDVESGQCLLTYEGHTCIVNSVCLSANGFYALSGSNDKTLKLWDVESSECIRTFEGHSGKINTVCLSTDGRLALSGSEDETIKLWDVESGECLRTFVGHTNEVNSVCLSADSRYALSGSGYGDKTLKLWEIKSGECLRTFKGHNESVESVCMSADDRYAISGSYDGLLKLWDLESGECLHTHEGHNEIINSVYLSADKRYALSGSGDQTLKLWELYWELDPDEID